MQERIEIHRSRRQFCLQDGCPVLKTIADMQATSADQGGGLSLEQARQTCIANGLIPNNDYYASVPGTPTQWAEEAGKAIFTADCKAAEFDPGAWTNCGSVMVKLPESTIKSEPAKLVREQIEMMWILDNKV